MQHQRSQCCTGCLLGVWEHLRDFQQSVCCLTRSTRSITHTDHQPGCVFVIRNQITTGEIRIRLLILRLTVQSINHLPLRFTILWELLCPHPSVDFQFRPILTSCGYPHQPFPQPVAGWCSWTIRGSWIYNQCIFGFNCGIFKPVLFEEYLDQRFIEPVGAKMLDSICQSLHSFIGRASPQLRLS